LPFTILALVLTFRHRRHKLANEVMRAMIEKGLPVPPESITLCLPAKSIQSNLRRGLVWLAPGSGLASALSHIFTETAPASGLWDCPAFVEAAYLTCWCRGNARTAAIPYFSGALKTLHIADQLWCDADLLGIH
jgi:hypothetical protein